MTDSAQNLSEKRRQYIPKRFHIKTTEREPEQHAKTLVEEGWKGD